MNKFVYTVDFLRVEHQPYWLDI